MKQGIRFEEIIGLILFLAVCAVVILLQFGEKPKMKGRKYPVLYYRTTKCSPQCGRYCSRTLLSPGEIEENRARWER